MLLNYSMMGGPSNIRWRTLALGVAMGFEARLYECGEVLVSCDFLFEILLLDPNFLYSKDCMCLNDEFRWWCLEGLH